MIPIMISLPLVANYLEAGAAFGVCMALLLTFGAIGGVTQGGVFALAGMFPGKYMGAVMFGNGISGIAMNALKAICLAAFPPTVDGSDGDFKGCLIYFILASAILVMASIGMVVFMKLPFAQYYIRKATNEKNKTVRRISGIKEDMEDENLLGSADINKTNHDSNT